VAHRCSRIDCCRLACTEVISRASAQTIDWTSSGATATAKPIVRCRLTRGTRAGFATGSEVTAAPSATHGQVEGTSSVLVLPRAFCPCVRRVDPVSGTCHRFSVPTASRSSRTVRMSCLTPIPVDAGSPTGCWSIDPRMGEQPSSSCRSWPSSPPCSQPSGLYKIAEAFHEHWAARRAERDAIRARADEQHQWVMAGDDRGTYGAGAPARQRYERALRL
jgi:hypothetical protein